MNIRGSRVLLGVLVSASLFVAVGCQEKQLKQEVADLTDANTKLRDQNKSLADENSRMKMENDNLLAQVKGKDKTIEDLQMASRPPQVPVAVAPPVKQVGDDTLPPPGRRDGSPRRGGGNVDVITVESDLLFAAGQATLKKGAEAELNKVAKTLKGKYAGHTVRIVGHTDSDPIKKSKWADNVELSKARAQAVADYLTKQGVPGGDIEVRGVGANQPLVKSEQTPADKAKNRRVSIQVIERG